MARKKSATDEATAPVTDAVATTAAPAATEQPAAQPVKPNPDRELAQGYAATVTRKLAAAVTPEPFDFRSDYIAGVRLSESRQLGEMQIAFAEKPTPDVIQKVKDAGYRWEQAEKVWAKRLGVNPMSTRIDAERLFGEVAKAIRTERGIEHSAGLSA